VRAAIEQQPTNENVRSHRDHHQASSDEKSAKDPSAEDNLGTPQIPADADVADNDSPFATQQGQILLLGHDQMPASKVA
jgi:hypothetical protein